MWIRLGHQRSCAVLALLLDGCLGQASNTKAGSAGSVAECSTGLIEDFEDGDAQILAREGRSGTWYPEADEEGTTIAPDGEFEPVDGGADGSKRAAHFRGKTADGKNVWAGIGVNFENPKHAYDASKYSGIAFRARRGKTATPVVIVRVPDAQSDPEGGECKECWNDFGARLELSPEWKTYVLPFDQLEQEPGWGEPKPELAASKLFGLKFQVKAPSTVYDIWLDDIRFVGCQP